MQLRSGNFTVSNINELENVEPDDKGIKTVIHLSYMGQFEYGGNTIPILRMLMEYKRSKYNFYKIDISDKNGKQMIMFASLINPNNSECLYEIAKQDADRNFSLYEYIKDPEEEFVSNFWWNIEYNYMIFFGEEKIDLINYFLDSCFERDGGKEEIGRKLRKENICLE